MKQALVIALAACSTCHAAIGEWCRYLTERHGWTRAKSLHPRPHGDRVALAEARLPVLAPRQEILVNP